MKICTIAMSSLFNIAPDDAFQITKENLLKLNLDPWDYLDATTDDNDNAALCFRMPWELALKMDYSKEQGQSRGARETQPAWHLPRANSVLYGARWRNWHSPWQQGHHISGRVVC